MVGWLPQTLTSTDLTVMLVAGMVVFSLKGEHQLLVEQTF